MNIKINNREWQIIQVKGNDKRLQQEKGEEVSGITSYTQATIYINTDVANSTMKDTILHELAHAFIDTYGFPQYETYTEENICDMFGAFAIELTNIALDVYTEWGL